MAVIVNNKNFKKIAVLVLFFGILSVALFFLWQNYDIVSSQIIFFGKLIPVYAQINYPKRLINLSLEMQQAGQDIEKLHEELKIETDRCNCQLTKSVCVKPLSGQINLLDVLTEQIRNSIKSKIDQKVGMLKAKIDSDIAGETAKINNEITGLQTKVNTALQGIPAELNATLGEIGTKPVSELKAKISRLESDIRDAEREVNQGIGKIDSGAEEKIKAMGEEIDGKTSQIIDDTLKEIQTEVGKKQSSELKEKNKQLSYLINSLLNLKETKISLEENSKNQEALRINYGVTLGASAGEITPEEELRARIAELNSQMTTIETKSNQISSDIETKFNTLQTRMDEKLGVVGDLLKSMQPCQPGYPKEVFGDPCKNNRPEIKNTQVKIQRREDQLSYLRKLLEKEMEWGLEGQLKEMDPDEAQDLRNQLEELLFLTQKIEDVSQKNISLVPGCSATKCQPTCQQGSGFSLSACLNPGEQKPIELKIKVGVGLEDLRIDPVKIKNVNLALPKEIKLSSPGKLSSYKIPPPSATLTFPEVSIVDLRDKKILKPNSDSIVFPSLSPTLPKTPSLELSCPNLPTYNAYKHQDSSGGGPESFNDLNRYFQSFSWLSQKCQEMPTMQDLNFSQLRSPMPNTRTSKCYDQSETTGVVPTILSDCATLWQEYDDNPINYLSKYKQPLPPTICRLIGSPNLREQAIVDQCENLFEQEGGGEIPPDCGETSQSALAFLRGKCQRLTGEEQIPEPCLLLPLFDGKLSDIGSVEFSSTERGSPAQIIADYPPGMIGCSNPSPTLSKITFPKITIPDIHLPDFNLFPLLEINLPDIIFEDLQLPDIELCNLDACKGTLPALKFNAPSIKIPSIKADVDIWPEVNLPDIGPIKIPFRVKLPEIPFPRLSANFPQLFNLGNLIVPELQVPKVPLPKPKFSFAFQGINVDLSSMLLGLVSSAFSIPDGCITRTFKGLPIELDLEDQVFSWPEFPKSPEIPYCKDINNFCKQIKKSLNEDVLGKKSEIEKKVNDEFQKIQADLDREAESINQNLTLDIKGQIETQANGIKTRIENHINNNYVIEDGLLKVPPLDLSNSLSEITVPEDNSFGPSKTIPLNWPEALKKIPLSSKNEISYPIPPIPTSKLSYEKVKPIKIPGLQEVPSAKLTLGAQYPSCTALPPTGGNPCPSDTINANLEEVGQIYQKIEKSTLKLLDVLK